MFEETDQNSIKQEKLIKKIDEQSTIKYYSLSLPSCGKCGYPEAIEYRDILVKDEKLLASSTDATIEALNKTLKSLLKDFDEHFDKLTLMDRDFLLMWIWANNYSTEKTLKITCRACSHEDTRVIDLTKITVNEISEKYKHPFKYTLLDGKVVFLRLATIGDERVANEFVKKNTNYDVASVIVALTMDFENTVMPLKAKLDYIENNIRGKDMAKIRAFHLTFRYGLDEKIPHTCSSCGEVTTFAIPFSIEHFLPTLQNDFEKML